MNGDEPNLRAEQLQGSRKLYCAGRTQSEYDLKLIEGTWPKDHDLLLMCDGGRPGDNANLLAKAGVVEKTQDPNVKIATLVKK